MYSSHSRVIIYYIRISMSSNLDILVSQDISLSYLNLYYAVRIYDTSFCILAFSIIIIMTSVLFVCYF